MEFFVIESFIRQQFYYIYDVTILPFMKLKNGSMIFHYLYVVIFALDKNGHDIIIANYMKLSFS
jgi:hypothetical protein